MGVFVGAMLPQTPPKSFVLKKYQFIKMGMKYNSGMSNLYTRTGDDGNSNLQGKCRVPKNHPITLARGKKA